MIETLKQIDTELFLMLNSVHAPFWDKLMWHISGKLEWLPFYLLLIVLIIRRYKWKSVVVFVGLAITIVLADRISVVGFKEVFQRLRPSHDPQISHLVHIVNNYRGGHYGFVSSHAANSFGLAVFMACLFKNKYWTITLLLWAFIVSYSRIYLGVHFPGDIIGGAILGSLCGLVGYALVKELLKKIHFNKIGLGKNRNI